MASRGRYDVFISYSHQRDTLLARALERDLQRFTRRWYKIGASLRVFRDETNLSASPGLWKTIEGALSASSWFILMASPDAAKSPWVRREVDLARRRRQPVRHPGLA